MDRIWLENKDHTSNNLDDRLNLTERTWPGFPLLPSTLPLYPHLTSITEEPLGVLWNSLEYTLIVVSAPKSPRSIATRSWTQCSPLVNYVQLLWNHFMFPSNRQKLWANWRGRFIGTQKKIVSSSFWAKFAIFSFLLESTLLKVCPITCQSPLPESSIMMSKAPSLSFLLSKVQTPCILNWLLKINFAFCLDMKSSPQCIVCTITHKSLKSATVEFMLPHLYWWKQTRLSLNNRWRLSSQFGMGPFL